MVKKYGLPMLITADEELKGYLETILKQVHGTSEIDGFISQPDFRAEDWSFILRRMVDAEDDYQIGTRYHVKGDDGDCGAMAIRYYHGG